MSDQTGLAQEFGTLRDQFFPGWSAGTSWTICIGQQAPEACAEGTCDFENRVIWMSSVPAGGDDRVRRAVIIVHEICHALVGVCSFPLPRFASSAASVIGNLESAYDLFFQISCDCGELRERCLEIFDDLLRADVGWRKIGAVFQALVFEPEDVEIELESAATPASAGLANKKLSSNVFKTRPLIISNLVRWRKSRKSLISVLIRPNTDSSRRQARMRMCRGANTRWVQFAGGIVKSNSRTVPSRPKTPSRVPSRLTVSRAVLETGSSFQRIN
jgi:hypothetical protein